MINFRTSVFQQPSRTQTSRFVWVAIFALSFVAAFFQSSHAQYLHRNGKQILDGAGNPIILRGMGLGGWMLQEGYMLEMNSFANPQHQIRAKIEEVIGPANTDLFYEAWYANHCTRRDIDSLKAWGFNSVRLPMHYNLYTLPIEKEPVPGENTWLEKGFVMTDSLIKWCAANSMYVILDLHAAPGGQGRDAAISDYDISKPSLWESEANQKKTVALWKKLAERYATEKWIGGYDLINEPNWNFTAGKHPNGCEETANTPLRQLYVEITTAIREVDKNHIIFIEGNCWANNHNGLFPAWDANMAISFHKYWNYNDQGSIQGLINLRNQHNLPLWMGESGENSNTWFTGAIQLLEKNDIGWAWWPMKKVGSVVCPLTIVKNNGYNTLLNYWKNGGSKPSVEFAKNALMQLAEDLKIENNVYQKDLIDAMFRQVNETTTIPYAKHVLPGAIRLTDFDLGRHKFAYSDSDTATHHVSAGSYTAWNNGWTYRNDGVDIERSQDNDAASNGFNVGWTADREWMQYTVAVDSTASYNAILRYAAAGGAAKIKLIVDGMDRTPVIDLSASGGNQSWTNKSIEDVILYKGKNIIRLYFEKGGANVSTLKFSLNKKINEVAFGALSATTTDQANVIQLFVNKKIKHEGSINKSDFAITVNGISKNIQEILPIENNLFGISLRIEGSLVDTDNIKISYSGTTLHATDDTPLENFSNLAVANTLPYHILIPAKIEAEDFVKNVGLQLETTTDTGGGQNIGYTNAGDYLEYRVRVAEAGEYLVELRVASAGSAGILEIQQLNENGAPINTTQINIPVTGGWQTWQTVNGKINLDAVRGILRLKIIQPEFNLNWFRFTKLIINKVHKNKHGSIQVYPNPADTYLRIEIPEDSPVYDTVLSIRNMSGSVVRRIEHLSQPDFGNVYVGDLATGLYILEISHARELYLERFMKR